jgi:hypothetical protein
MKPHFFTDSSGKPSHTRLLVAICVPILVLLPLSIWAYISIVKLTFVPIDATIPLYIGTANGIILGYAGFKSVQENTNNNSANIPTTSIPVVSASPQAILPTT